jgi:hypothetical protein
MPRFTFQYKVTFNISVEAPTVDQARVRADDALPAFTEELITAVLEFATDQGPID